MDIYSTNTKISISGCIRLLHLYLNILSASAISLRVIPIIIIVNLYLLLGLYSHNVIVRIFYTLALYGEVHFSIFL